MNIYDYDRLYSAIFKRASDGEEYCYLTDDKVKPGRVRIISRATAEDKTTDFTKLRLGIKVGPERLYLDELTTVSEDELVVEKHLVLLGEGDELFAEFKDSTTNDELVLTVRGWEKDL